MPYLYPVEVKDSLIQGKGLFAMEDIPKGEVYWVWSSDKAATVKGFTIGENIAYSKEQLQAIADQSEDAILKILHCGFYYAQANLFLFFRDGSEFMNHSYEPNSQIVYPPSNDYKELVSYALRDIKKGEEIVESYGNYLSLRGEWIANLMKTYYPSKFNLHCQINQNSKQ